MKIREANKKDLDEILQLYLYLHEERIPEDTEHLRSTWENIISDVNHHLIVCEVDDKIVASCVCVIIPNLTRSSGVAPSICQSASASFMFLSWSSERIYTLLAGF